MADEAAAGATMMAAAEEAREERSDKLQASADTSDAPATGTEEPAPASGTEEPAPAEAAADEAGTTTVMGAIGIDVGAEKCVTAASSVRRAATAVLVRNDLSNEATPTVVGFKEKEAFVGEDALAQQGRNVSNTIEAAATLLCAPAAPEGASFTMQEDGKVPVSYCLADGEPTTAVAPELLCALLLKKLAEEKAVCQTISDSFGADVAASGYTLTLAVPSYFSVGQRAKLACAAAVAGLPDARVVPCHCALAAQYTCRHAKQLVQLKPAEKDGSGGDSKMVLFVDVGASHCTASVCEFTVESVVGGMVIKTRPKGVIKSMASEADCGGSAVDAALFAHLAAETLAKHGEVVKMGSRVGNRLLRACQKAKKVLSSVEETPMMVENLIPDMDVRFQVTRSTLEGLIAGVGESVTRVITQALAAAGVSTSGSGPELSSIEIVGGGTRTPFVQKTVLAALGGGSSLTLSTTLDSASAAATGVACMGAGLSGIEIVDLPAATDQAPPADEGELATWTDLLVAISAQTAAQQAIAAARSNFESLVYDFRNQLDTSKHKSLLKREEVEPLLNAAEDWMYSEHADTATLDIFESKLAELNASLKSVSEDYFTALANDDAELEKELKAGEAARLAEEAVSGDSTMDTKLPYKQRMHKVELNKKEGNELVKDGNYGEGIKRYNNALMHCSKFFDLSPEQMDTLKAAKLSLFSNIAMCANKQSDWKLSIDNCTKALEIDSANVKALFRRATAYEKTNKFEEALADLANASQSAPEDKNVAKATKRVQKAQQKQKDKEKKMYGKMFS